MSNRKKQLFAFLIVISVVINLSVVTSANSPTPDDYSSSAVQYELKTMDGQEITTEEDIIVDLGDERLRSEKNDKKHESDIDIRKQVSLQVKESKSFLINDKIKNPIPMKKRKV